LIGETPKHESVCYRTCIARPIYSQKLNLSFSKESRADFVSL
jgi:hypothetical protein